MTYVLREADLEPLPPLLTFEEVAATLHVTVRSVQRYVQQDRLKIVRTHHGQRGKPLVPRRALAAFLSEGERVSDARPNIVRIADICRSMPAQRPRPYPDPNVPTLRGQNDE